jgi:hypothetical protein
VLLDESGDGLEPEPLCLFDLERRRIDQRAAQPNSLAKCAATTPVDPPMSSIVLRAEFVDERTDQLRSFAGVFVLLRLNRSRIQSTGRGRR